MDKFGKSQPVKRVEDVRFLTGHGRYIDDIAPENALFGFFLRSPVAHAELRGSDLEAARTAPGVHLVLTADDLLAEGIDIALEGVSVRNRDGTMGAAPLRPALARGRVCFVGEDIALVVAETLAQARDAAEMIDLDLEELTPHVAVQPGGAQIHPEVPENIAYDWEKGDAEATAAALAAAARVVRLEVADNRIIANSMEPRGCFAQWDGARLHFAFSGQGVWGIKDDLVRALHLAPEAVRATTPDVGGGFGMKGMNYPEYLPIAAAAKMLGRPVRWMSDRNEAMQSDNAGRDLVSLCEMGFDDGHRMVAYRVTTLSDLGAYNSQFAQAIQSELFAKVLMGTYDVQTTYLRVQGIYTNTTQVDAYRGAGRPEAIYALERTVDHAARALGVDSWELRRRNFIAPDAFPYVSATGETYDVGDFGRVLNREEVACDRAGFAARRKLSAARGRLRGQGLCYYIESILGDPSETARVEFNPDGTASIFVGTQSNGQGHETVYAQFLSDQTGIPAGRIRVVQGDSDLIKQGGGTGGSRSVTVQNTATLATVDQIIKAFSGFLAAQLGVPEEVVEFDDTRFRAEGSNLTPTILEVADMARAAGRDDILTHEARTTLPARSFPNGAHVAEVEIDPETGHVALLRYSVTDDFGHLINPMLVEGQIHGGVAQGVGQALMEQVVYDEDGQLLTASFMDYALPRAQDLPFIGFGTQPTPSTANVMGMKGCGEAGTVGALAAVANAVADALSVRAIETPQMPFTSLRIWQALQEGPRELG